MRRLFATVLFAFAPGFVLAQGMDPHQGRNLAATCANCHGTDGRSVGGMSSLAGMPKQQIVDRMREFREGKRPATIMHQLAKGYTEQQVEVVATFFAAQKP